MGMAIDITGQRYGRLVALEFAGHLRSGSQPKRAFRFRCDCGVEVVRTVMDVRRLDTMSCGCLKRDNSVDKPAANRLAEGESGFRALFGKYQRRAKLINQPFTLTREGFSGLTLAPCYYCATKPSQRAKATATAFGAYIYNGVDRLDPTQGYIVGNVVPCCGVCNRAKQSMQVHEFLDWVRRVYQWRCYED